MTAVSFASVRALCTVAVCTLLAVAPACAAQSGYGSRAQSKPLIRSLVQDGFSAQYVRKVLNAAKQQPTVIQSMQRPAEALPWYKYRHIFIQPDRVRQGAAFVRAHAATFKRAQARYGVPEAVIAAILGVETRYGLHIGQYRVLDALATLSFDYPPRAHFFQSELKQFFLMTRQDHVDITQVKGSYAGAMGLPQFIASSYRHYAVDFNHDGRTDLWHADDAIGSVANFLAKKGWQHGQPIAIPAFVDANVATHLKTVRFSTDTTTQALHSQGVQLSGYLPPGLPVGLVKLQGKQTPEYWLAAKNFFVITSYNHSPLYAMAVFQLAQAIDQTLSRDAGSAG